MMTTQLVRRQLAAYQEAWKEDYQSAQECLDCEDFIRMGLFIFDELQRLNTAWRERVYRGRSPYSRDTDKLIRSLFSGWLEVSSNLLRRNVAQLTAAEFKVEGAEALAAKQAEAIEILHTWKAPKISILPGLRHHVLTAEQGAELQAVAAKAAVPTFRNSPPSEVSYEEFRKRRAPSRVAVGTAN